MPTVDGDSFVLAAAHYRLGRTGAADVVDTAAHLIATGHRSDTLLPIAALSGDATLEVLLPLIERAVAETGHPPLTVDYAATLVARHFAGEIAAARLGPYEGAKRLWGIARTVPALEDPLAAFIHLAGDWEDHPAHRATIGADITHAATTLFERVRGLPGWSREMR